MKNELFSRLQTHSPLLVASLDGDDLPYLMEQARTDRADAVEIRLDLWGHFFREDMPDKMARLREKMGLPMLVSFRGGRPFPDWWQPLHWRALRHAAMIDVEWNPRYPWREIRKNAAALNLAFMISHHDYKETPGEKRLVRLAQAAFAQKADIVKIATRVRAKEDVRALLAVCARFVERRKLMTVMGMGRLGTLSRLVSPLFGSCLLYGYIGTPTANGQLPYKELQERIRALYPADEENERLPPHRL